MIGEDRFCPKCGAQRQPGMSFCGRCGASFAGEAPEPQRGIGGAMRASDVRPFMSPEQVAAMAAGRRGGRSMIEKVLIAAILLVVVGGVASLYLQGQVAGILDRIGASTGGSTSQVLPAPGTMWFGSSFETGTLAVRGRTTTVGTNEAFVGVARLPRTVDGSELLMRVYLDGQLISTQSANAPGTGDAWGWSLGPLFTAGTWRWDVADVGGNVLASGSVTAK